MFISTLLAATLFAGPVAPVADPVDGARAYVAALVDHDPSEVPLHPRATRVEAGLQTGFSGEQIRTDLRYGPQYRVIAGVRDAEYRTEGDVVVADYLLDVALLGIPLTTVRIHETFAFEDGLIRRIVADIALAP